jgi:hypothetical protein
VYLLELVPVGQRAARHVDVMPCRVLHSEHDTVPRVADTAAHLRQHNGTSVLVLHVLTHRYSTLSPSSGLKMEAVCSLKHWFLGVRTAS